jgi:peroxiredoxin
MKKLFFVISLAGLGFGCEKSPSPAEVLRSSKEKILGTEQVGFRQTVLWEDPNLGDIDTFRYESIFQKNPEIELGYDFFGKKDVTEFWYVNSVSYGVNHEKQEVQVWDDQPERLYSNSYLIYSPVYLLSQKELIFKKDTVVAGKSLMDFMWVEMDTVVMDKKVQLEYHLFMNPANSLPEFLSRRLYHDGKRNQLIEVFYSDYSFDQEIVSLELKVPQEYVSKAEGVQISVSNLLEVGEKAPDFRLRDLDGNWINLSDFKGKKVLLDFSMIHCGWCKIAIDEFKKPTFSFAENVVPLYLNPVDEPGKMEKYQSKVGIPFPALIDAKDVGMAYGVKGYPTFYLIDEKGKIELVDEGYSDELIKKLNANQ